MKAMRWSVRIGKEARSMTNKEKELLKSRFQQRWTQEKAKEFAGIACGYMYAIGDALEASMKQSKATEIVRGWADEVEEKLGASLEL